VAALRFLSGQAGRRLLVVEWGSRPGLGTARVLREAAGARFLTVHQAEEGEVGAGAGVGVRRVPAGAGGAEMRTALRDGLEEAGRAFVPDLVLLSLGCDALEEDPLGRLALAPRDYHD